MDMYMRYFWTDPRLQYSDGPEKIAIPFAVAKEKFWFPDVFFTGVRTQSVHGLLSENAMVRLDSTGKVFISVRYFCHRFRRSYTGNIVDFLLLVLFVFGGSVSFSF